MSAWSENWLDKLMRQWERSHPGERMSIRELAKRAEVSPQTVQRLKQGGGAQRETMRKIADVLEIPIGVLVENGDE
jgi:transcriptional regulator with XRE-family HTH domain